MKIYRGFENMHPMLVQIHKNIKKDVILAHNMPFRIFETSREHSRHQELLNKRKTRDLVSGHLFDLTKNPPMYAISLDYVFYDGKWSWNIRNSTILEWYKLFGNLVLDICPELEWAGMNRESVNYNHFTLRKSVIIANLEKYPCMFCD